MNESIIKIAQSEDQGRFLKAGKNIAEGSLLLKESPLIVGPQGKGIVICFRCCRVLNTNRVLVCSKCKIVSVCSDNCKGCFHDKQECEFISNTSLQLNHILTDSNIIMPLRCLVLRAKNKEMWQELIDLESHIEERRHSECQMVALKIEELFLSLGLISPEDSESELIPKICGILDVNTFEIRSDSNTNGIPNHLRGLYLKASLMNHNCIANTHLAVDDDFDLIIGANRLISQDEGILFNYANPLQGNQERRSFLKQTKYFDCNCERCSDPSELGTEISSLVCPRCKDGFVRESDNFPSSLWICSLCKATYSPSLIRTTIGEAKRQMGEISVDSVSDVEALLKKFKKTFSANHFLMLELKQNLIGMLTQMAPNEKNLVRKIQLCEELLPVFTALEPGISRMFGITMHELQRAKFLLLQSKSNNKSLPRDQYLMKLKEIETDSKNSIKHLLYEPKNSPEGRLCLECLKELKNIRTLILEEETATNNATKGRERGTKIGNKGG